MAAPGDGRTSASGSAGSARPTPQVDVAPVPLELVGSHDPQEGLPYLGEQTMIFPSTAGTWRDPSNFSRQWREVRDELGATGVTSDSFRKTVATLIDDEGMSARIGADHLGHSKVSMTQDVYMSRGRVHPQVAELLERVVVNDE